MVKEDRIVKEFLELVQIDSESKDERKIADVLTQKLKELGLEVWEDNTGEKTGGNAGNVIGRLKGNQPQAKPIFLSAHMDTVTPGIGVRPQQKEGVIYSAGDTVLGADDKSGIVAILEALRALKEDGASHGDIEVIFSVCEEIGLIGAINVNSVDLQAKMGFVLDSSGDAGTIIVKGPTQDVYKIAIFGRAAHAGVAPEEGINAIQVAAHAISRLKLGRIDQETTANIGVIHGGKATNIITELVNIEGEARSLKPEKLEEQRELIKNTFEDSVRKFGARLEFITENQYPMIDLKETDEVVEIARQATAKLGLKPQVISSGGGSDANIYNGKGIPTVNLGMGMEKVHTTEESIKVINLVQNAKLVLEIIKGAGEG